MNSVFISGTDTDIGKTFVSSMLVSALQENGHSASYWKPVQTGDDSDTNTILSRTGKGQFPKPTYHFKLPAAPWQAAVQENSEINLKQVVEDWNTHKSNQGLWVVEGAGGLLVPLTAQYTVRDLVRALDLPLLIVASTRLGTVNHTLLSIEAARKIGLQVIGVVLVEARSAVEQSLHPFSVTPRSDLTLEAMIENLAGVPVLARIPVLHSDEDFYLQSKKTFQPALLKRIFKIGK